MDEPNEEPETVEQVSAEPEDQQPESQGQESSPEAESQDQPSKEDEPAEDDGIKPAAEDEAPAQHEGGEIEKVDLGAEAAAERPATPQSPKEPQSPKKKAKDIIHLKVELLEGKSLDLEEPVSSSVV